MVISASAQAFLAIEEKVLAARLEAVRAATNHAAEKGRALEKLVSDLLRTFLPSEYGVTTGFVIHDTDGTVALSSQQDIIIYDSLRSGPLIHLDTFDVIPLEGVLATVEVKASLRLSKSESDTSSIYAVLQRIKTLRTMRKREYFRDVLHEYAEGKKSVAKAIWTDTSQPPIRNFIFAFALDGAASSQTIAETLRDYSREIDATHCHGLIVPDRVYLHTIAHENMAVAFADTDCLARFKFHLLEALASSARIPLDTSPNIGRYVPLASGLLTAR